MHFLQFCKTILFSTLLLIVNTQAIPADNGITIKPIAVRDNVIELDVLAVITIVPIDFNNVVNVL